MDNHSPQMHRERIERMAREQGPGEPLWFEARRVQRGRGGARWKAVIGRREQIAAAFSGESRDCALVEFDYPSQLPKWLDAVAVTPQRPLPRDWRDLPSFGCPIQCTHPQGQTDQQ